MILLILFRPKKTEKKYLSFSTLSLTGLGEEAEPKLRRG